MDFCTSYFGKKIPDLIHQDIVDFFAQERTETDQIEFKSINVKSSINERFTGIQKAICAFLNSSGGMIIWGAPEGKQVAGRKEKVYQGKITYFDEVIEKDFAVSKISDNITPLPNNIRLTVINHEGKSIIVIEIDSSEYSPHQTENIYYMRIDGQSKPAPHHYIEALFKKIKYPNLELNIKIRKAEVQSCRLSFEFFFCNFSPLLNEEKFSFRILVDNGVFENYHHPSIKRFYRLEGHEFFKENVKDIFYYGEPILESATILFNLHAIKQKENKASLLITFGGRFSPRKSSEYTLDFTKLYDSDPNNLIAKRNENKLTKDIQDEKGVNKEKVIESFMNLGK